MIFSGVNTGLLPFSLMTHFLDMNTLYTEPLVSMEMVCFLIQGLLHYLDKKDKILSTGGPLSNFEGGFFQLVQVA